MLELPWKAWRVLSVQKLFDLNFLEIIQMTGTNMGYYGFPLAKSLSAAWIILALGGLQSPDSKFARSMRATPH